VVAANKGMAAVLAVGCLVVSTARASVPRHRHNRCADTRLLRVRRHVQDLLAALGQLALHQRPDVHGHTHGHRAVGITLAAAAGSHRRASACCCCCCCCGGPRRRAQRLLLWAAGCHALALVLAGCLRLHAAVQQLHGCNLLYVCCTTAKRARCWVSVARAAAARPL
jgi:hypothetical protein